jgi:hypothetical protein
LCYSCSRDYYLLVERQSPNFGKKNLIDAKVVQVDAANDLALLKADGRFAPLPIAASRTGLLGGTVATVGFPDIGLQGFAGFFNHETHELHEKLKDGLFQCPLSCVLCISWFESFPLFWPRGKSRRCPARGMTRGIFKSACRCSRAIRAGRWWMSGR